MHQRAEAKRIQQAIICPLSDLHVGEREESLALSEIHSGFTANATAAMKLVGESFPFAKNGTYVLGADSHNSLHGIREFTYKAGSHVVS